MKPRSLVIGVALILSTMLGAGFASAATFDNMFPTGVAYYACSHQLAGQGRPCQTDNSSLTVWHESSIDSTRWSDLKAVLRTNYDPTDLSVIYSTTPSYSGSSETDVVYRVSGPIVPPGYTGATWCDDAVTNIKCDQAFVAFDTLTDAGHDGLGCHETGHAVGLVHGHDASPVVSNTNTALGCMVTPVDRGVSLGSHNAGEINATY